MSSLFVIFTTAVFIVIFVCPVHYAGHGVVRIGPFGFQAGRHTRRQNLVLVYLMFVLCYTMCNFTDACLFCSVRFCGFSVVLR